MAECGQCACCKERANKERVHEGERRKRVVQGGKIALVVCIVMVLVSTVDLLYFGANLKFTDIFFLSAAILFSIFTLYHLRRNVRKQNI